MNMHSLMNGSNFGDVAARVAVAAIHEDDDEDNEEFFDTLDRPLDVAADMVHRPSEHMTSSMQKAIAMPNRNTPPSSGPLHQSSSSPSLASHGSFQYMQSQMPPKSHSALSLHTAQHSSPQSRGKQQHHQTQGTRRNTDPWSNAWSQNYAFPISLQSPLSSAHYSPHPSSSQSPSHSSKTHESQTRPSQSNPSRHPQYGQQSSAPFAHVASASIYNHDPLRRFSDSWEPSLTPPFDPHFAKETRSQHDSNPHSDEQVEWMLDPALLSAASASSSDAWSGFSRAAHVGKAHSSAEQYTRFGLSPTSDRKHPSVAPPSSILTSSSASSKGPMTREKVLDQSGGMAWPSSGVNSRPRSQSCSNRGEMIFDESLLDDDFSGGMHSLSLDGPPKNAPGHASVWGNLKQNANGAKAPFTEAQLAAVIESSLMSLKNSHQPHTMDQVTAAAAAAAAALVNGDFAEFTWSSSRQFCEVEFKAGRREIFTYPTEANILVDEYVFVEADRGKDLGRVTKLLSTQDALAHSLAASQAESKAALEMGDDDSMFNADAKSTLGSHSSSESSPQIPPASSSMAESSSPSTTALAGNAIAEVAILAASNAASAKRVLRRAHQWDVQQLDQKLIEERRSLLVCQAKVQQRSLPMEVIDAEYQYDRKKLTFYFKAESRIDFRELVRDLFRIFKTRIWMKQTDGRQGKSAAATTPPASQSPQTDPMSSPSELPDSASQPCDV
eukprot:TRINITY_DN6092_c0_g1_i1.p1 TRINITY_DN6092_c0_g1~~TRINITY_DN6092_c0_g1_i1.p1  ORF type:complete len:724 (+),score=161.27 TRINITY_DN6092_c0_g1_i1:123-2294(+)